MGWAAFGGMERSNLYALNRDPESKRNDYSATFYLEVFNDNFLGIYESGLIFMQDNASIYTDKKVKAWFAEQGIKVMEWSPYSPDLNLFEHLWFLLKEMVYKINPDIEKVGGDDDKIREILFDALVKVWDALDEYHLYDLAWNMEKKVKAIIATKGWYTKY